VLHIAHVCILGAYPRGMHSLPAASTCTGPCRIGEVIGTSVCADSLRIIVSDIEVVSDTSIRLCI
jgi:hypothetical protein